MLVTGWMLANAARLTAINLHCLQLQYKKRVQEHMKSPAGAARAPDDFKVCCFYTQIHIQSQHQNAAGGFASAALRLNLCLRVRALLATSDMVQQMLWQATQECSGPWTNCDADHSQIVAANRLTFRSAPQ